MCHDLEDIFIFKAVQMTTDLFGVNSITGRTL